MLDSGAWKQEKGNRQSEGHRAVKHLVDRNLCTAHEITTLKMAELALVSTPKESPRPNLWSSGRWFLIGLSRLIAVSAVSALISTLWDTRTRVLTGLAGLSRWRANPYSSTHRVGEPTQPTHHTRRCWARSREWKSPYTHRKTHDRKSPCSPPQRPHRVGQTSGPVLDSEGCRVQSTGPELVVLGLPAWN